MTSWWGTLISSISISFSEMSVSFIWRCSRKFRSRCLCSGVLYTYLKICWLSLSVGSYEYVLTETLSSSWCGTSEINVGRHTFICTTEVYFTLGQRLLECASYARHQYQYTVNGIFHCLKMKQKAPCIHFKYEITEFVLLRLSAYLNLDWQLWIGLCDNLGQDRKQFFWCGFEEKWVDQFGGGWIIDNAQSKTCCLKPLSWIHMFLHSIIGPLVGLPIWYCIHLFCRLPASVLWKSHVFIERGNRSSPNSTWSPLVSSLSNSVCDDSLELISFINQKFIIHTREVPDFLLKDTFALDFVMYVKRTSPLYAVSFNFLINFCLEMFGMPEIMALYGKSPILKQRTTAPRSLLQQAVKKQGGVPKIGNYHQLSFVFLQFSRSVVPLIKDKCPSP